MPCPSTLIATAKDIGTAGSTEMEASKPASIGVGLELFATGAVACIRINPSALDGGRTLHGAITVHSAFGAKVQISDDSMSHGV